jgi:hypothetical protein
VTSVDGSGDESAQSLGISPAAIASAAGNGGGAGAACFVNAVSQSIPRHGLWFVVLLIITLAINCRRRVHGARRTVKKQNNA